MDNRYGMTEMDYLTKKVVKCIMGKSSEWFLEIREKEVNVDDYDYQYQQYLLDNNRSGVRNTALSGNAPRCNPNCVSPTFLIKKKNKHGKF